MPVVPSPYNDYSVQLTGAKIVKSAMRKITSLGSGDEIDANELADGLECLNDMLDAWNSEELSIPSMTTYTFPLVNGTATYNVGPGETFDMPRPAKIMERQATVKLGNLEYPLRVYSQTEWANIRIKDIPNAIPYAIFYDQDTPSATISFYPIPGADSFIFYAPKLLAQITNANEIFYLPNAYSQALKFGLSVYIASEYGKQAPPDVVEIAAVSKARLKELNKQIDSLKCDIAMINYPDGWVDSAAFERGF